MKGIGYDKEITDRIESRVGIPAITTSTAVMESFRTLGVEKVMVATPYDQELNQAVKTFIEDNGFQVATIRGLEADKRRWIPDIRHDEMYRLVRDIFTEDADAIFISCAGISVIDIIEPLETDLKRPTVTSIQATVWAALRRINVQEQIHGFGKLLTL